MNDEDGELLLMLVLKLQAALFYFVITFWAECGEDAIDCESSDRSYKIAT